MQTRDNKRARLSPSAPLDVLDSDLLIRCASYLDADELAQLGRTSARFGIPQAGHQRSLVNEAAHQQFQKSATDEERSCLPKSDGESDIGLYRALDLLRKPLRFDELVGNGFGTPENQASVTSAGRGFSTAMSNAMSGHAMRGGRHFVEFSIASSSSMPLVFLGVIRPVSLTDGIDLEADWNEQVNPVAVSSRYKSPQAKKLAEKLRSQRTAKWKDSNVHCCTYYCADGDCCWTDWNNVQDYSDWQGSQGLGGSGRIGLLLDLTEGTLSVFNNGRRLGVMKDGLGGEYVWFVSFWKACAISMSKGRAPN